METPNPSLKRKRIELNSVGDASKIPGKLHHGLREVRKAAKKAKTFETQKLVKKLKDMRRKGLDNADILEYEAQLRILKNIDHEIFANTATKTKITKDHVLFHHQQVQEYLSRKLGNTLLPTSMQDSSSAKVHSRLLSSKVLAMEISSLCGDLRGLLGNEQKKSRFENNSDGTLDIQKVAKHLSLDRIGTSKASDMDAHLNAYSEDEEKKIIHETGWESGTVDEEENHDNNDRIFSDEGETDEEAMEGDYENGYARRGEGPEPLVKVQPKSIKQSGVRSTFLPSLSVGFVRGSDDSGWSDNEAKIADSGKKNRRGQRARRAIWEKKYGKNANHKRKELRGRRRYAREEAAPIRRKIGYRGPVPLDSMNSTIGRDKRPRQREPDPLRSGGSHQREPIKSNEKSLHPSWEAKRKLREKQSVSIVPSQGTKIKFSD